MKSLPIDTIVKVKEYGIGIIVDVIYSSKLMVKFPNGTIICNDNVEDTYIDALWEFDPDSIILNRICFNGISIITSENTKDGRVQVGVNQWAYVPSLITNIKKVL